MKHYLRARQAAAEYLARPGNSARDLTYSERNELRKQISRERQVDIAAQSVSAAIVEVAQNYGEYETDPGATEPQPEGATIVTYSAQTGYLFHDGGWYFCAPAKNGDLILPLLVSDDPYHQEILPHPDSVPPTGRRPGVPFEDIPESAFSNGVEKLGQSSLVQTAGGFELHLSVTRQKRASRQVDEPRYVVGVDRGRNELVYAALYDRDEDHVTDWVNISGSEIEHVMDQLAERIASVQEAGALDQMLRLRERRHRVKRQKDYEVANAVVDLARQAGAGTLDSVGVMIALEDLAGMSRLGNYARENRRFNEWSYYRQQQAIQDKAEPFDIPVTTVDPAYTSQECSRCGSEETRRSGVHFHCRDCAYDHHADANAAVNTAKQV
jgi:IS605 OrfB family transposase